MNRGDAIRAFSGNVRPESPYPFVVSLSNRADG